MVIARFGFFGGEVNSRGRCDRGGGCLVKRKGGGGEDWWL